MKSRNNKTQKKKQEIMNAVSVFQKGPVEGHVLAEPYRTGVRLIATFTKLPEGKHGFHIHKAGDLRGEGCQGACSHFHIGAHMEHGAEPTGKRDQIRHTGDLGNIELGKDEKSKTYTYILLDCKVHDLFGRAMIVHADEDDLGLGGFEDSKTTGHSGARIGCAIFGRATSCGQ